MELDVTASITSTWHITTTVMDLIIKHTVALNRNSRKCSSSVLVHPQVVASPQKHRPKAQGKRIYSWGATKPINTFSTINNSPMGHQACLRTEVLCLVFPWHNNFGYFVHYNPSDFCGTWIFVTSAKYVTVNMTDACVPVRYLIHTSRNRYLEVKCYWGGGAGSMCPDSAETVESCNVACTPPGVSICILKINWQHSLEFLFDLLSTLFFISYI